VTDAVDAGDEDHAHGGEMADALGVLGGAAGHGVGGQVEGGGGVCDDLAHLGVGEDRFVVDDLVEGEFCAGGGSDLIGVFLELGEHFVHAGGLEVAEVEA
jgi:hypothetical protein